MSHNQRAEAELKFLQAALRKNEGGNGARSGYAPRVMPLKLSVRGWGLAVGLLLLGFVAFNAVAYRHARAMMHFAPMGERTPDVAQLSTWKKVGVLFTGVTLPRPENQRTPAECGLAFTVEKYPGARGTTLEAWRMEGQPNAPRVFLFHGYGGSKDSLLEVAQEFHSWGCEVWLVDFHGSGGSSGNTTSVGYHEATDVAASVAFATQRFGPRKTVLFGTSMGAAAILRAVHLGAVQPDALVLECPFDSLLHTAGNRFHLMHLPMFPFAHLLVFWGGWQQGFNGFNHNPAEYAASVRCPTLLLQGGEDTRVTLMQAQAIADALGARGEFKTFPRLSHQSYVQAEPVEWRRIVSSFLAKHVERMEAK